jgi:hypothetical protein
MKTLLFVLAAGLLAAINVRAQQYGDGIDINIRSGVDSAEQQKRDHDPAYAKGPKRGRVFFMARVSEEKTGEKLVRPVDAGALAKEVVHQLEAQGFHAVQPGQKPDIVVTVKYGRGLVTNPYTSSDDDKQHTGLSDTDSIQVWPTHQHFVGMTEKMARLRYEKLIIQVRAWEYPPPTDPKKKEKLLWMTTMFVDDPDHRDLNVIATTLLAKGAPYFDRHIGREDQVIINTNTPEGHVNVGPIDVVKDPKSK